MKLLFKRTGFLFLMALLGGLSLFMQSSGYPFAWRFSSDQVYWLPLMYSFDLLFIVAVIALVFWGLRGFLFGRGRPWLAWFSISAWVLVWSAVVWHDVDGKAPFWTLSMAIGNHALNEKVQALEQQAWSVDEIKGFPDDQRTQICSNAILEEETRITVKREGFPIALALPKDLADKGLFDAEACPTGLVAQYQKLKDLRGKVKNVLSDVGTGQIDVLQSAAAQMRLSAHPDAIVRMSDIYKTFKESPVERVIAMEELTLRIYTNGQVLDHQWEEIPDQADEKFKRTSIDHRIWHESDKDGADAWNFWIKADRTDGSSILGLWTGDCNKRTLEIRITIETRTDGAVKLQPANDEPHGVIDGSVGDEYLQIACASKDQQARIPDDRKNKKFGE